MKRILIVALLQILFGCILTQSGAAQTNSCYIYGHSCFYDGGVYPPVPWGATSGPDGLFCVSWSAKFYLCDTPVDAAQGTCTTCSQVAPGWPINLSTGDTYIVQTDVNLPGLGGGLVLTRTWNSIMPAEQRSYGGMFGNNWRTNFEERLIYDNPDHYVKYTLSDGAVWSFGTEVASSTITYRTAAPANNLTRITSGDTYYTLAAKDGTKKLFDSISGLLMSIIDRNGNATQLSYDSNKRLTTVTDAASRHLYFGYPDSSSRLVSTVTSDVGISLSYTYDDQGRLTHVTKPDNSTVSFDYDANSMITAVRDSDGKILESHSYDVLGRGLTSSRANGVESLSVTYPQ